MKKRSIIFLFLGLIIVLVLTGAFDVAFRPKVFRVMRYIDLNSGDLKSETYFLSFQLKNDVGKTRFSKEVRRLGIDIPDNRIWKYTGGENFLQPLFAEHGDGKYGRLIAPLDMLEIQLNLDKIPDNNRVTIIEDALDCIKNEEPKNVRQAFDDILNKHKDTPIE